MTTGGQSGSVQTGFAAGDKVESHSQDGGVK